MTERAKRPFSSKPRQPFQAGGSYKPRWAGGAFEEHIGAMDLDGDGVITAAEMAELRRGARRPTATKHTGVTPCALGARGHRRRERGVRGVGSAGALAERRRRPTRRCCARPRLRHGVLPRLERSQGAATRREQGAACAALARQRPHCTRDETTIKGESQDCVGRHERDRRPSSWCNEFEFLAAQRQRPDAQRQHAADGNGIHLIRRQRLPRGCCKTHSTEPYSGGFSKSGRFMIFMVPSGARSNFASASKLSMSKPTRDDSSSCNSGAFEDEH